MTAIPDGFYLYREEFLWGRTPAYRNDDKTEYRFISDGKILNPVEMAEELIRDWRPTTWEGMALFREIKHHGTVIY